MFIWFIILSHPELYPTILKKVSKRYISQKYYDVCSTIVHMSIYDVPDGNNLAHIQCIVIQLGYKDGCHCLIECCAIHVNSGAHWEDKAGDPLVYAVVLLGTSEGDRQGSRAGKILVGFITVTL